MSYLDPWKRAMEHLPRDVRWAQVNIKRTASTVVCFRDGSFSTANAENSDGLYVQAAITGEGMAYGQDLAADPGELIAAAAENGRYAPEADVPGYLLTGTAACPQPEGEAVPAQWLFDRARVLSQLGREDGASVLCTLREDRYRGHVLNSLGGSADSASSVYSCQMELTLTREGQVINAGAEATADMPAGLDGLACYARALERARLQLLPTVPVTPGSRPAVLDSDVMCNILITAWQLFSALKVQAGSSAFTGRLGQRLAGPAVTVIDRPAHPLCGYRYGADDEGTAAPETVLMDRGVLTGLLHTRRTAAVQGCPPTGNAGRVALLTGSIPTAIIPIPRILTMEPGTRSRDELLASMGDGLYIPYSFDIFHSIDIATGDFSIPCRAVTVREGRMAGQCADLTMSGNLLTLLESITELGSDLAVRDFLLRSYCYGAPSAAVASLHVG